jgi:hypothetical protein
VVGVVRVSGQGSCAARRSPHPRPGAGAAPPGPRPIGRLHVTVGADERRT